MSLYVDYKFLRYRDDQTCNPERQAGIPSNIAIHNATQQSAKGREEAIRKKIFICFEWQLFNATAVGCNPNEEKSKQLASGFVEQFDAVRMLGNEGAFDGNLYKAWIDPTCVVRADSHPHVNILIETFKDCHQAVNSEAVELHLADA